MTREQGENPTSTALFERLKTMGTYNPLTWAIIWSTWHILHDNTLYMLVPAERPRRPIFSYAGDDDSIDPDNVVTALLETLRHTPVGSAPKQGIPVPAEAATSSSSRLRLLMRSLSSTLFISGGKRAGMRSLGQLEQARTSDASLGMDPVSIFALNPAA